MTTTITIGSWVIPLAITLCAFGATAVWDRDNSPGDYDAGIVFSLLGYGLAAITSLIAWLVWAVLA